jgi:hypothetical protein
MPLFDVTIHDKSGALMHRVAHQVIAPNDRKAINDVVVAYGFNHAWQIRAEEAPRRERDVTVPTVLLSKRRR